VMFLVRRLPIGVSNQLISLTSRETKVAWFLGISCSVSNQLISLTSRESARKTRSTTEIRFCVSNQLISLTSREQRHRDSVG
jgi:hypothetical protein